MISGSIASRSCIEDELVTTGFGDLRATGDYVSRRPGWHLPADSSTGRCSLPDSTVSLGRMPLVENQQGTVLGVPQGVMPA